MKRIIVLFVLLLGSIISIAQPVTQRGTASVTVQDARLFAELNFRPPAFPDTVRANQQIGLDSCGALIYSRDINAYYYRACSPKRWVRVASGGSTSDSAYLSYRPLTDSTFLLCRVGGTRCDTIKVNGKGVSTAWIVGGNTNPSPPNLGTISTTDLNIITNNVARMKVAGNGINRSSAARNKYLMIDTSAKYLYYGDADTAYTSSHRINDTTFSLCRTNGKCDTITIGNTIINNIINYQTRLISGSAVWDSLMIYSVTQCNYYINGILYTSSPTNVTLDIADSSNPRIDVIYCDTLGNVGVITGIPSPDPVKPTVNPLSQIELTHINVNAQGTTPAGVSQRIIYNENVGIPNEWNTSVDVLASGVDFAYTTNPYVGTKSALAPIYASPYNMIFTNNTFVNGDTLSGISMYLRLNSAPIVTYIRDGNGIITETPLFNVYLTKSGAQITSSIGIVNSNFGYDRLVLLSYQHINIPISNFVFKNSADKTFDGLVISVASVAMPKLGAQFDYITAGAGVNPPAITSNFWSLSGNDNTSFPNAKLGTTSKSQLSIVTNDEERINITDDGVISIPQLQTTTDTLLYKPLVIDPTNGQIASITNWGNNTVYTENPIMSRTSNDSNIIYFNPDTAAVWRGGGTTPTLQQVLDNNHDLVNGINLQGTGSGESITGININSFGTNATYSSYGNDINAMGENAAGEMYLGVNDINAFGNNAGYYYGSTGSVAYYDINLFGSNAGKNAVGSGVNAFGYSAGMNNSGTFVNAFGNSAALGNTGAEVNAFGASAGIDNIYSNVNLFGTNAQANNGNQIVFSSNGGTYQTRINQPSVSATYDLPNASGTIPLSVNGNTADANGNITISGGSGTVTDISQGYGITASPTNPITTSGTIDVDTTISGLSGKYLRLTDTSTMLSKYVPYTGATGNVNIGSNILYAESLQAKSSVYVRDETTSTNYLVMSNSSNKGNVSFVNQNPGQLGNVSLTVNPLSSSRNINLPDSSGTVALKDYTVNSISRTLGKDSIIFFIGSTRYAIKDSVGTNPPASGYYLSISDSTTQDNPTANTPRAVKFNTTDLANGFSLNTQTAVFVGTINNGGAGAGTTLNVTSLTSGKIKVGMVLTGGSITAGTFISAFISGSGGIGTYEVSVSQLKTSATYTGTMTSQIVCANTGIYNLQFSSQMDKTDAGVDYVNFWLRKNGTDITASSGVISLQGNSPAYMMAAWNYVIQLVAGDTIELYWGSADINMSIKAETSQTIPLAHPAVQSTIFTITQQAGILAGTGITAINSLTGAAQTMVTGTDSTDFRIVSTGTTHKFNLPTASATNRGLLSSANWTTFNSKLGASDTVSLSSRINLKLNIADTSSMLSPYLRKIDTTNRFVNNISRTVGKDSIIFNIGSTRYAIKDSVGSGTSYTFSTGLTNTSGTVTSNLSTGVSGGQSVVGGTAASENLTLSSTSNATKGNLIFGTSRYFENTNNLAIGKSTDASFRLDIQGNNSIKTMRLIETQYPAMTFESTSTSVGESVIYLKNAAYNSLASGSIISHIDVTNSSDALQGGIAFYKSSSGKANISLNGDSLNGNNVLIGTKTDAGYKLYVNGTTRMQGAVNYNPTNTAAGTTGNQTINKASGTVNIAAAGTTVTVTNSLVSATSIVYAVIRTNDATATIKNVVPAAGSFVINLGAAATAEVSIGFFVIN